MNRIAVLVVIILVAPACAADASQHHDANGQVNGNSPSNPSQGKCAAGQTEASDGTCTDTNLSCTGHAGPCNTALAAHPLTGCFAANYKAPVTLGDGNTYQLTVDTGSSNMAVASNACPTCAVSPRYVPGASATNDNANVTSGYADGSGWRGPTYTDIVHVDDHVGDIRMAFTAISAQLQADNTSNVFFGPSQCDGSDTPNSKQGILGMGGTNLVTAPDQAFMDMMQRSTSLPNAFSVQLCDNGGRIWYGGYDPNYMTQAPQFIPMDVKNGFYRVTLDDVAVNGASIDAAQTAYGPTIADTGTGAILLPNAAFEPVVAAIEADPNFKANFPDKLLDSPGQCVTVSKSTTRGQLDATLPTLTFLFAGPDNNQIKMALPATSSYLLPLTQSDGSTMYCSTLGSAEALANQSTPLLGNPFMHGLVTIFDRENAQLGFAPQRYCEQVQ